MVMISCTPARLAFLIQAITGVGAFVSTPSTQFCGRLLRQGASDPKVGAAKSRSPRTQNFVSIDDYKSHPEVDDGLGPLDFGVTDSLSVPNDVRPTLKQSLSNPRDILALVLVIIGGCSVAFHNIAGIYGPSYETAQRVAICLGFLSVIGTLLQLQTSYLIAPRRRMGLVDDAALTAYAGLYSGAASWLALRTSSFCPASIYSLDNILPWAAAGIFAYSLAAPAITLVEHLSGSNTLSKGIVRFSRILSPAIQRETTSTDAIPTALSDTELFRIKGLLFIGIIGSVFVPACLAFAFQGQEWWQRVVETHPKQTLLESTDALFGLFATEASMIATRSANAGVAPYRKVVPVFAGACLVLALVPCMCSLWWLGGDNGISFFSFYTE